MPRKQVVVKREILPDPKYNSKMLAKFVNVLMRKGKKSTAEAICYKALDRIQQKTNGDPIAIFKKAVENCKPLLEVKTRRVGGANYQVPIEVPQNRRTSLALGWIGLVQALPMFVFAIPGGQLADRFDRRHVMLVDALLRGALVFSVPVAAALGHHGGQARQALGDARARELADILGRDHLDDLVRQLRILHGAGKVDPALRTGGHERVGARRPRFAQPLDLDLLGEAVAVAPGPARAAGSGLLVVIHFDQLHTGQCRHQLARRFVDAKVPRDERDRIPIIASGSDIVWIAGHRADERFKVKEDTKKILRLSVMKGKC